MEKYNSAFKQLLLSFQMQGMIYLGKVKNPMTQKVDKNLSLVQSSINTLEALKEKTKGNLEDDEEKLLNQILYDLQMNYVEESKQESSSDKRKEEEKDKKEK